MSQLTFYLAVIGAGYLMIVAWSAMDSLYQSWQRAKRFQAQVFEEARQIVEEDSRANRDT